MIKSSNTQNLQDQVDQLGAEISSLKNTVNDLRKRLVALEEWGVNAPESLEGVILVKKKMKMKKKMKKKSKKKMRN